MLLMFDIACIGGSIAGETASRGIAIVWFVVVVVEGYMGRSPVVVHRVTDVNSSHNEVRTKIITNTRKKVKVICHFKSFPDISL